MGVKSTTTLTRLAAEEKFVSLMLNDEILRRRFRSQAVFMSDVELENALEELNDATYGRGGGYDNYSISEYGDD